MWDSEATPWNSMDMGPKRDITGELAAAVRKRGMKLVTTFHHERNLQRCKQENVPDAKGKPHRCNDSHYPCHGIMPPYNDDPQLRLLYGNMPEQEWLDRIWLGKLHEVIDRYQPDLIWFDSWLDRIPETYRQRFCADYLNRARAWNKDVVIVRKQDDLPLGVSVEDFEKGRADRLTADCWLTDDTISRGSWSYTEGLEIKPAREVLHSLIDIVSKNGCMLLNISPMADGSIPDNQRKVLLELGEWLKVNGEAIYGTRPWSRYGDGPTKLERGGHFIKEVAYTAEDIRYTRTKDDLVLYAITMGVPAAGSTIVLSSVKGKARAITMLGSEAKLVWERGTEGLKITMPDKAPNNMALVFRIDRSFE
jgi:alpha-L-fucosidase